VDDRQTLTRGQLLEKERAAFVPLPPRPFPACREEATAREQTPAGAF